MQWGGPWSCLNLQFQDLLTPNERLYPLGGAEREINWGYLREGGIVGERTVVGM